MTRLLLLLTILICTACDHTVVSNNASVKFSKDEHDFKHLEFKAEINYSFLFENQGEVPLLIQHVKTSCGCTVPEWPKKPIKPGEKGEIKIEYNTSHPGRFRKTISVFYNGEKSPIQLVVKGAVKYPEEN